MIRCLQSPEGHPEPQPTSSQLSLRNAEGTRAQDPGSRALGRPGPTSLQHLEGGSREAGGVRSQVPSITGTFQPSGAPPAAPCCPPGPSRELTRVTDASHWCSSLLSCRLPMSGNRWAAVSSSPGALDSVGRKALLFGQSTQSPSSAARSTCVSVWFLKQRLVPWAAGHMTRVAACHPRRV